MSGYNRSFLGTPAVFGAGSIDIIQNGQSTTVPGTCDYGGDTDPVEICSTQKVSILLGTSFSIEASASVDEPTEFGYVNQGYTTFGEGGSFTIQDANGSAVASDLLTAPLAAPEPSHLALIGVPLQLMAIGISRRRTRRTASTSFSA